MNGEDKDFLSRFEATFTQTRDDVNILKQGYAVLQRDISGLVQEIKTLSTKLEEKSRTNWPAIGLAVSLFTISVPGLGFIMASYTANAVTPIANTAALNGEAIKHVADAVGRLQQDTSASSAADVASRTDRAQLNDRVKTLEAGLGVEIADRRAAAAATRVSLAEIETQFHAVSNIDNLRAAQQERLNSLLWERSFRSRYPNSTFFTTTIFSDAARDGGSPPTQP